MDNSNQNTSSSTEEQNTSGVLQNPIPPQPAVQTDSVSPAINTPPLTMPVATPTSQSVVESITSPEPLANQNPSVTTSVEPVFEPTHIDQSQGLSTPQHPPSNVLDSLPISSPPEQPKSKSSIISIVLVVIALILISILGYVFYMKMFATKTNSPVNEIVLEPTPATSVDDSRMESALSNLPTDSPVASPTAIPATDSMDVIPTITASPSASP